MPSNYTIELPHVGDVSVTKKRGMRSIRLRVTPKGHVAVSAPWYVPKATVAAFLYTRLDWIQEHYAKRQNTFYNGMRFGRSMTLTIHENAGRNRSRLGPRRLDVYFEHGFSASDKTQQLFIQNAIYRTLKREAESILLPRLLYISQKTGHDFNQAYIKRLTGRWGSCDAQKNIILSSFLVQLPDNLIDYVIVHELAHTKHLNHSVEFWNEVGEMMPNYKLIRKQLRLTEPRIIEQE